MDPTGIAVVTGSSRGIGRAIAVELARRGFETVATMRDPAAGAGLAAEADALAPGAGARVRVAGLDVERSETIVLPDGLRVLVNNAGTERAYLPVEVAPTSMWREVFETNLFGLVEVTRRAIPLLRATGGGVICNISSSSILAPVPFYAAYRASKAAVGALGESLRAELAPFGIRVLEVMPGPIRTDMYAGSERPPEALDHEPYRPLAARLHESRRHITHLVTEPAVAAAHIVDAICDDDAPLRVGCDPLGIGMLDQWRSVSDE